MPPGAPRQRTMDRILEVSKLYLYVADKSRDAAALLLAKWVEGAARMVEDYSSKTCLLFMINAVLQVFIPSRCEDTENGRVFGLGSSDCQLFGQYVCVYPLTKCILFHF